MTDKTLYDFINGDTSKKRWKDLTRKELNTLYRYYAKDFNETVECYNKSGLDYNYVNQEINFLSGLKDKEFKRKTSKTITQNPREYKSKADLMYAVRNLKAFSDADILSPRGQERERTREQKAYESFLDTYQGIVSPTKDEWRAITNLLGSLDSELMEVYGSDVVVQAFAYSTQGQKKINLYEELNTIYKKYSNKSLTQSQIKTKAKNEILNKLRGKK